MGDASAMVEIVKAGDLFEARLIVGRLQSEGIPADIAGEHLLETLDGVATMWAGGVPIEVPREMAERAIEVLSRPALPEEDDDSEIVFETDDDQDDD